jgi:hypothetical protein
MTTPQDRPGRANWEALAALGTPEDRPLFASLGRMGRPWLARGSRQELPPSEVRRRVQSNDQAKG